MSGQNPDDWGAPPSGQPASGDQNQPTGEAAAPPSAPPPQTTPEPFTAPAAGEQQAPPAYGQFASATPPTPAGAFPSAPVYGVPMEAKPTAPPTVLVAFWLWIVVAIWELYSAIRTFAATSYIESQVPADVMEQLRKQSGMTSAQISDLFRSTAIFMAVVALLVAAVFVLCAFKLKVGKNWARILGVVFAAFGVLAGITALASLQGLVALVCVASIVCVFLQPSNQFFAALRRSGQLPGA